MQARSQAPIRTRGLVLLELLVAGCVLALLIALAVPSFAAISDRWKVRHAVDTLTSSLYAARAEAFRRGGRITLARSDNSEDCSAIKDASHWDCGWTAFVDANENGKRDEGDELLFVGQSPSGLEVVQTSGLGALKFDAWGEFMGLGALSFKVCSRSSASTIAISSGGRIRATAGNAAAPRC
ncbi:MAG: GspH/FimT family pseudopilin [Proteobacteria bacterium]|nr:GspH/FimT family pseudopilin [Pseudomonadota bacterium]